MFEKHVARRSYDSLTDLSEPSCYCRLAFLCTHLDIAWSCVVVVELTCGPGLTENRRHRRSLPKGHTGASHHGQRNKLSYQGAEPSLLFSICQECMDGVVRVLSSHVPCWKVWMPIGNPRFFLFMLTNNFFAPPRVSSPALRRCGIA
jgi:hypothetical protein